MFQSTSEQRAVSVHRFKRSGDSGADQVWNKTYIVEIDGVRPEDMALNRNSLTHSCSNSLKTCAERSTSNKRLHTERGERRGTRISSPSSFARLYGVLRTSVFY